MSLPNCPTDCTSNLPGWNFSKCAPEINYGQISKVFFTTTGNPLSNWANALEWDSRLDNDAAGASQIRTLIGIGSLPVPEKTEKEVSLGRKVFGKRSFTMPFFVDETNTDNHNAMRTLQCNTGNYLVWFQTLDGGMLLGGNAGIEAKIDTDLEIPEGSADVAGYRVVITWKDQFMPEMITSPITDDTGDQF